MFDMRRQSRPPARRRGRRRCHSRQARSSRRCWWSVSSTAGRPGRSQVSLPPRFKQGLGEAGYIEDEDVRIDYRLGGEPLRSPASPGCRLVRMQVAVIVASSSGVAPAAAKAATSIIPIVFTAMPDPVKAGLVVSLNRPGGNLTGTAALTAELDAKAAGRNLAELVPYGDLIGALVDPNRPDAKAQSRDVQEAARALGRQMTSSTPATSTTSMRFS